MVLVVIVQVEAVVVAVVLPIMADGHILVEVVEPGRVEMVEILLWVGPVVVVHVRVQPHRRSVMVERPHLVEMVVMEIALEPHKLEPNPVEVVVGPVMEIVEPVEMARFA